jgi:putative phage-type endonuclease
MEQRSDEWFAARLGKVTASKVADVAARTKSGYSASRANYMAQLICERLTGQRQEVFTNADMQHGTDTEPLARAAYVFYSGNDVSEVGLIDHPNIAMSAASPDGLVMDDGLLEIKCPKTATHIDTLLGGSIEGKYITQMQWQMACTGRAWCDFVSFDNRLPEELSYFCQRVMRDDKYIAKLESEVKTFIGELEAKIESLKSLTQLQEAA